MITGFTQFSVIIIGILGFILLLLDNEDTDFGMLYYFRKLVYLFSVITFVLLFFCTTFV